MSRFQEIFQLYGADYENTMNRFMGNEEMYLRILDMLFKDDNLEKLGTALEEQDYKSAFEAAHTLKGVVGNMGLTPLYDAVCAIVEPLRAGMETLDYRALYQNIQSCFEDADQFRSRLKETKTA
ncbi:Hpt domain-containing protein [Anaerolentibacter hominis]|uniref:Hpt domain-containing protein n=1 Tax=Anaerolentibacter hominis TaxID=3079009 RepID=UPI0031B8233F